MQHRIGNFPISEFISSVKPHKESRWDEDAAQAYAKLLKNDPIAMAIIYGDYHEPVDQFYIDKIVEEHFMFRHMVLSHRDTSWKFGDANNIDFMETLIKLMRENHKPDYFESFNYTLDKLPDWRLTEIARNSFANTKRWI